MLVRLNRGSHLRGISASVIHRTGLVFALTCVALLGCPPAKAPVTHPAAICAAAEGVEARLQALLDAGKLDRAARLLSSLTESCPAEAARWRDRRLEILTDLGDVEAVARLTGQSPPGGDTAPALPQARQVVEEGMAALRRGDGPAAQRRFDRARVALLRGREPGQNEVVDLRVHGIIDVDEDRLLLRLEEPASGRKPVGVFGRSSLTPQWLLDSADASLVPGGVVAWGGSDDALQILKQGQPPRIIEGASNLEWVPGGLVFLERVGAAGERARVVLYDVAADRRLAQAEVGHSVDQAFLVSIGGSRLQMMSDNHLTLLRLPDLEVVLDVDGYQLHWSANGRFLAVFRVDASQTSSEPPWKGDVSVYDTLDGRLLTRTAYPRTADEPWRRLSDDGRYLGEGHGSVRVLDVRRGRWRTYFERVEPPDPLFATSAPIFSADGAYACAWEMGRALVADLVPGGAGRGGDPLCFHRDGRAVVHRVRASPGFQHVKGLRTKVGSIHPQVLSDAHGVVAVLESHPRPNGQDAVQLQLFDVAKGKVRHTISLGIHNLAEGAGVAIDDTQATVHVGVAEEFWAFDLDGHPSKRELGEGARNEDERDLHNPFPRPSEGDPAFAEHRESSPAPQELAPVLPESWRRLPPFAVALGERSVAWLSNDREEGELRVWTAGIGWRLRRDEPVCAAAFAPGDTALAAADCDEPSHVRVQRLADGGGTTVEVGSTVAGLALSVDGRRLAVRHWRETVIYDVATGRKLRALPTPAPAKPETTALSTSGDKLAVLGDQTAFVYAVDAPPASSRRPGAILSRSCDGELRFVDDRQLMCGAWLVDVDGELSRTLSGPLTLREVGQRKRRTLDLYGGQARAGTTIELRSAPVVSRSLEGSLAWVALANGTVLLVDRQRAQVLATLQPSSGGALAVLDDGHVDPMGTDLMASKPTTLFCRYGTELVPLQVCGERWLAPGALAQLLVGSRSYRQP